MANRRYSRREFISLGGVALNGVTSAPFGAPRHIAFCCYNLGNMTALSSVEDREEQTETSSSWNIGTLALLIGFSVFYFADVSLRASQKYFWFDELGTLYQARLSMPRLLDALRAGFDFNPPFLYLFTKLSNSLFGEGLIVTRLPEILAFWVFSACLFRFVGKRAGPLAGFSVMVLPMFTGAFYYAFEARPHGLVLAFCGLALVAWQMSLEACRETRWLILFSLALFAAFMMHAYAFTLAVAFGIAELFKSARARRVEYRRWAAVVAPALLAVIAYVPLLHAYRAAIGRTNFLEVLPRIGRSQISAFYISLLTPCILLVLISLTLLALKAMSPISSSALTERKTRSNLQVEIVLALSFLLLPVFGVLLAFIMHSPFFSRYVVSALAGVCILIGFGVGLGRRANWVPVVLAGIMAFALLSDVSLILWHKHRGWAERLIEPSSGFSANASLQGPLANYEMLVSAARSGKRVAVLWGIDFLYLVNYAPELRSQLYYVANRDDALLAILDRVRPYTGFPYHMMTWDQFYARKDDFLLFGFTSDPPELSTVTKDVNVQSMHISNSRFLAEVSFKTQP